MVKIEDPRQYVKQKFIPDKKGSTGTLEGGYWIIYKPMGRFKIDCNFWFLISISEVGDTPTTIRFMEYDMYFFNKDIIRIRKHAVSNRPLPTNMDPLLPEIQEKVLKIAL